MMTEQGRKRGGNQGAGNSLRKEAEPLIDARVIAEMCGVSVWLLYKMAGSGRMPKPIKIGRLLRWKRREVEKWIAGGCKAVRAKKGGKHDG